LEQQVAERTAELTKTNEYLLQAIVEREQTEEALAQALAQAQAANRLKSQLLARVSHELRTPLNAILGYAEMLELGAYGDISDRQRQAVSKIVSSNNSLTSLVNELLDLASLEAGKLVLTMTSFTPVDIVDPVLARLNVLAQRKGLSLTSQIAADTPRILFGDPNRVQQILTNLVGNAIKFTETGSVEVSLYRPDARYWAMQVSDTGPGIPPEAQQYIFEPFRQVDGSMTRLHKGSGLGLSIVKELTTLIGGQVMVESEPGRGSAFTVLLPLHPVQETPNNGPVERIATDGMEGLTKEF
jgi:signal transduction histidine kinase